MAHATRLTKKIGFRNIGFASAIITDPAVIARMNDELVLRTEWPLRGHHACGQGRGAGDSRHP